MPCHMAWGLVAIPILTQLRAVQAGLLYAECLDLCPDEGDHFLKTLGPKTGVLLFLSITEQDASSISSTPKFERNEGPS